MFIQTFLQSHTKSRKKIYELDNPVQYNTYLHLGVKPRENNPLKKENKYEYNDVTHPHQSIQKSSLDCPMPTLSLTH